MWHWDRRMQVQLFICEPDATYLPMWSSALRSMEGATVLPIDNAALAASYEVQALYLHHAPFHECFGGRPQHGTAQIRSTQGWPFECYHPLPPVLPP